LNGLVVDKDSDEKEYELTVRLTATRKDQSIFTYIRAGQDNEGTQLEGEAREYLKVTYLKPLRDALSELTPGYKSRLAEILGGHSIFKDEKDDQGNRIQHKLEEKTEKANKESETILMSRNTRVILRILNSRVEW